ncbi:hypothetical protein WJX73_010940 [Symbiochloris irregularis]|uniref:Uncharacterized protein n=1 Tax=Symbiochloris irregularis TaxID=706552 RepID=A0AAW1NP69_9CHLO
MALRLHCGPARALQRGPVRVPAASGKRMSITPTVCQAQRVPDSVVLTPAKVLQNCALAGSGALLAAALLLQPGAAWADLNKLEADAGGEFGIGTAQQMGSAEINNMDFHSQDLRRSNFTSAECRKCNFKDANLAGAYFIKAVVPKATFENANVSDVLMDRAVLNDANLTNANLQRTVFTRSDLTGAQISGADFTNALLDRPMQMKLCRYADGTNSITGADTRQSLGCGSRKRFRDSSPSAQDGPQAQEADKEAFRKSMPTYRK